MKKQWEEPRILIQEFAANEYVAACGDTEYGKYKFVCDAPAGTLYYYRNGKATWLGSYHPCSASHEASTTDPFYDGFVDRNRNRKEDEGEAVIVWRGPKNNNGHATSNLDRDSWETTKS